MLVRGGGAVALAAMLGASTLAQEATLPPGFELVATGVDRPLQLALVGRTLLVLAPGPQGDVAGELHRLDLDGRLPADVAARPRTRLPFPDARLATFGSMALEPSSRDLFLGEENGRNVYRLDARERMTLYLGGLHRLPGGSALAFDGGGRLVLVDHADPNVSPGSEQPPPGLEQFRDEEYRGPLVFRLALDPGLPLPRRVERIPPLFPRAWGGRTNGAMLPWLVAVAPIREGLVLLSSRGMLYRLGDDARLVRFASLPSGQYVRVNMTAAADGSVYICGGFTVPMVFRVAPGGVVTTVAGPLADPQGVALDGGRYLYVAESSLHRIIRRRLDDRPAAAQAPSTMAAVSPRT